MARTNGSEHLRYRYGICLNDQCSKCKSKEVQTILARKDFVCEECGKQLRECPPPVSFWGKYGKAIIAAGVVVVLGAGVGGYFAFSGDSTPEKQEVTTDTTKVVTSTPPDTMTAKPATETPEDNAEPQKKEEPQKVNTEPSKKPAKKAPSANSNYGTVKVSYGKYTGYLENGKPHGHGTVVFTSSYRFAEGISAEPGDKYEGEFRNGRISGMGYLYHNGNQTMVRP